VQKGVRGEAPKPKKKKAEAPVVAAALEAAAPAALNPKPLPLNMLKQSGRVGRPRLRRDWPKFV
jgi:hypothetical protein